MPAGLKKQLKNMQRSGPENLYTNVQKTRTTKRERDS